MNHQAAEVPQACKPGNVMWKLRVSGADYKQLYNQEYNISDILV